MTSHNPLISEEPISDFEGDSSNSEPSVHPVCSSCSKSIHCTWIAAVSTLAVVLTLVIKACFAAASRPSVCIISVAIGNTLENTSNVFIDIANLTGESKQMYADKWNYRYVPYLFDGEEDFMSWCHSTALIKVFGAAPVKFEHPAMKFFPLAHALSENGCDSVLMMDADAIIINMSFRFDFDLPDTGKRNGDPHMMFALHDCPQGLRDSDHAGGTDLVPLGNTWCDTGCTDLLKFRSCLNTGLFYFDGSAQTMDFIDRMMRITMMGADAMNCSTKSFNPWKVDQCLWEGDQCMVGCALYNHSMELGRGFHEMPDGVVCVPPSHQPPVQALMRADWLDGAGKIMPERQIPNGTFIVNIIHIENKLEAALAVMKGYPHLRKVAEAFESHPAPAVSAGSFSFL